MSYHLDLIAILVIVAWCGYKLIKIFTKTSSGGFCNKCDCNNQKCNSKSFKGIKITKI